MVLGKAHVSIIMHVSWTQPLHWCWPCYRTATQLRWLVWGQITLEEQRQVALKEHLDLCQYLDTMEKTCVCLCLKGKKNQKPHKKPPNQTQTKSNQTHATIKQEILCFLRNCLPCLQKAQLVITLAPHCGHVLLLQSSCASEIYVMPRSKIFFKNIFILWDKIIQGFGNASFHLTCLWQAAGWWLFRHGACEG